MKALTLMLLVVLGAMGGLSAEMEVRRTVQDAEGELLGGILVHARPIKGNDAAAQTTRTDEDGEFSFTLPDGEWWVQVDAAELLERGYFCEPGWNPNQDLPTLELPSIAVPLTPRLDYEFSEGKVTLVAGFDWMAGLQPVQLRQCRIERSRDLVTWEEIATVSLQDPPLRVEDPYLQAETCFYRAVDVGVVRVSDPRSE